MANLQRRAKLAWAGDTACPTVTPSAALDVNGSIYMPATNAMGLPIVSTYFWSKFGELHRHGQFRYGRRLENA
jgi:hypothetical protein